MAKKNPAAKPKAAQKPAQQATEKTKGSEPYRGLYVSSLTAAHARRVIQIIDVDGRESFAFEESTMIDALGEPVWEPMPVCEEALHQLID